ncbi:MAG: MoaD/ThiS family protein [Parvularculaceae bacterium]|nr:MoaD/ThiS family protein [Parvularculaceae bacterium]
MAKLVFYGRFADFMGRERSITIDGEKRLDAVIEELALANGAFADAVKARAVKFAINDEMAPNAAIVADSDEIAVLPPFSGG